MKKRLISILLLLTLLVSMTACSDKEQTNENNKQEGSNEMITPTPSQPENVVTTDTSSNWSYGQVAMGGGGFVSGVFSTSEENLFYARTDVGGAYRWDESTGKWINMNYGISEADRGLYGIEALASDPSAPNKVYLLAGTDYFSNGKTAIMCSDDYGKTFTTVELTDMIKVHGNGYGRQNGERLAVDPKNGSIILAGGRTGGLIISKDYGKTWEKVSSFPVTKTANGNGINGIVFDPYSNPDETSTSKIYVSVSQKGTDNVYVSEDSGSTWNPVAGLPTENMPQRLRMDTNGNLYITYGASEGPSSSGGGGIYKLSADGSISDISPENKIFGDIAVHPEDPNKLVACTESIWSLQPNGSWGDEFYVSTNGGVSWKCINSTMKMNNGGIEWITKSAIHWCGCLTIDPYNPDTIMVTSGNGIFRCDNIWDETPEFTFFVKGLEETVPLDCISIPNGTLFSAIGDYDGFEHTDIFEYGKLNTTTFGTTTSIAVAGQNPDIRAKVGGNDKQQLIYSLDGGKTWKSITNAPSSDFVSKGGSVTLTADGSTLIWSTSYKLGAFYTTDWGNTWNEIDGLHGGHYVLADSVNPDYVYAIGSDGFLYSEDGGKSFNRTLIKIELSGKVAVSHGNEGCVYIPCESAGLFYTSDHGVTNKKLPGVTTCKAVGLGKGKTDGAPYVIYIWGQPGKEDPEGIYMSEDEGVSWTRINSDAYQFGGTGNGNFIVGDYNVYGRFYLSTIGLGLVYGDMINKQ